jgi:hypothetical protein
VAKERREGSIAEAIHVFGEKNFDFTVLDKAKTQRDLQELEKRYIVKLNTLKPNGYNLSEGGTIGKVPGRSVEIKSLGLKFKTVAEAARYFGIQASALLFRLDKGYSPEQSVGLEPLSWTSPRWTAVEIDGMTFPTIKEAAAYFGHPANRIRNRTNKGWSIERALKTPYASKAKPIMIDGVQYPSIRQAAKAIGISNDALKAKLAKSGRLKK